MLPSPAAGQQWQERVRLEAGAVLMVLGLADVGAISWIASPALYDEVSRNPDEEARLAVLNILRAADEAVDVGPVAKARAIEFNRAGIKPFDAVHLGIAESAGCQALLTTDDRFRRRARSIQGLGVRVENPLAWLVEYLQL